MRYYQQKKSLIGAYKYEPSDAQTIQIAFLKKPIGDGNFEYYRFSYDTKTRKNETSPIKYKQILDEFATIKRMRNSLSKFCTLRNVQITFQLGECCREI